MKKILIYLSIFGLLPVSLSSCKESFLDQDPEMYVTEASIYASESRIESTVLGLYSYFKGRTSYSYFMGGRTFAAIDNMGDDFENIGGNLVTLYSTYKMNVLSSSIESYYAWYFAYLTINNCNLLIENLVNYNSAALIGQDLVDQYTAEAKFLRAMSYYYLCGFYAEPYTINPNAKAVPLRLTGIRGSGSSNAPRATISAIYDQILIDLDDANIADLPTATNSYDAVTRASQAAAYMLKMRVYMAMNKWPEAITAGENVTGYSLVADPADLYTTPYYNTESIFSLPMSTNDKPNTQLSLYEYFAPPSQTCVLDLVSGIASYPNYSLSNDLRVSNFFTVSGANTFCTKFDESDRLQWVPIFRYAETLLDLAECYYHNSNLPGARTALNTVRSRSIPSGDAINVMTLSGSALLDAITNEKRLEFLSEGMRGFDIRRKGETFVKKGGAITVAPGAQGYTWAIPDDELVNNSEINN